MFEDHQIELSMSEKQHISPPSSPFDGISISTHQEALSVPGITTWTNDISLGNLRDLMSFIEGVKLNNESYLRRTSVMVNMRQAAQLDSDQSLIEKLQDIFMQAVDLDDSESLLIIAKISFDIGKSFFH